MNTLLSIFHLLLMLTHNHLLPDMGSVWKEVPTENVASAKTVPAGIQVPAEKQHRFQTEAVCEDRREFYGSNVYSQATILFLLARQHTGWPRRPTNNIKRYLVFCQLKTEG